MNTNQTGLAKKFAKEEECALISVIAHHVFTQKQNMEIVNWTCPAEVNTCRSICYQFFFWYQAPELIEINSHSKYHVVCYCYSSQRSVWNMFPFSFWCRCFHPHDNSLLSSVKWDVPQGRCGVFILSCDWLFAPFHSQVVLLVMIAVLLQPQLVLKWLFDQLMPKKWINNCNNSVGFLKFHKITCFSV